MLKEVGASGQISLGKRHAGKSYHIVAHRDGQFELIPAQVGASVLSNPSEFIQAPDGWVPPGGYDSSTTWALENRDALEQYALQIENDGTAAEQLQRFLSENPDILTDDHVKV